MLRCAVATTVLTACGSTPTEPRYDAASNRSAFEAFWQNFDQTYPYFTYKQVDWRRVHDAYLPLAEAATSDTELIDVLRASVAPLRDVHIWFSSADGTTMASYDPPRRPNWDKQVWSSYLPRLGWKQQVTNWGYGRVGDIGYLAIGGWNTNQVKIGDVDAALDQLRDTRALIIDVRMNGGGNDQLAFQVAGRFTTSSIRWGTVQYRNGPKHDDFGSPIDRTVSPRGTWQYTKPVLVLVGAGCFSSSEDFAAAMQVLPNVTLVGDTTGGGSGNPTQVDVVRGGKWSYMLPRWIERLNSGAIIEWQGIIPDTVVAYDPADVAAGKDPVLDWALRHLGVASSPSPQAVSMSALLGQRFVWEREPERAALPHF